jgi:hypothetical protein
VLSPSTGIAIHACQWFVAVIGMFDRAIILLVECRLFMEDGGYVQFQMGCLRREYSKIKKEEAARHVSIKKVNFGIEIEAFESQSTYQHG